MHSTPDRFDVTLITPTGDRPASFALAERWMARQTFTGKVQWIIIDDGATPTACTRGQQYIRRERKPDDQPHTLPMNLLTALEHIASNKIIMIEDDDWYASGYVEMMADKLENRDLVGISRSWYVRLSPTMYKKMGNGIIPALACTAFTASAIPFVEASCKKCIELRGPSVDLALWASFIGRAERIPLDLEKPMVVQFKGVPGRPGLLPSHHESKDYIRDPGQQKLRQWIGNDLNAYQMD